MKKLQHRLTAASCTYIVNLKLVISLKLRQSTLFLNHDLWWLKYRTYISRRGREETLTPKCTLLYNSFELVDLNEVAHRGNTPSIGETCSGDRTGDMFS